MHMEKHARPAGNAQPVEVGGETGGLAERVYWDQATVLRQVGLLKE